LEEVQDTYNETRVSERTNTNEVRGKPRKEWLPAEETTLLWYLKTITSNK
jgi:hypothetical protein